MIQNEVVWLNNKIIYNIIISIYIGTQSPIHMNHSGRTDRTFSGQTITTRNSSSDRPSTYNIRPSVRRNKILFF